jgi:hypothetical protein
MKLNGEMPRPMAGAYAGVFIKRSGIASSIHIALWPINTRYESLRLELIGSGGGGVPTRLPYLRHEEQLDVAQ